ncbi:cytochrome P450 [Ramaria rubella]|nr:cytochrome P450 [Ramaria rubella]
MPSLHYTQLDVLVVGGVLLSMCLYYVKVWKSKLPLPPGPKPLPIIGNVLDLPKEKDWETYGRWAKEYGDIVHVRTFGRSIIILNSYKAVNDLMEKRSSNYSDRPHLTMLLDLMDFSGTAFQPYGSTWRKHRTLYHQQMNQVSVQKFQHSQVAAVGGFLSSLLTSPQDYLAQIRFMASNIVMGIAYGQDLVSKFNQYVALSEQNASAFVTVVRPGAFLVDIFPILKYIPEWFPGARFQTFARKGRINIQLARDAPFADVKKNMVAGVATSSFVANALTDLGTTDEGNDNVAAVKMVAGGIFAAGSDTTTAALHWFILAMTMYPEIQKRAQAEIDSVVGPDRLPIFKDRPYLPYIGAIVKEVFRWFPVSPTALPHLTIEEDVYEGFRIPAKSLVLGNVWNILHDSEMYPNPTTFNPERFLPDKEGIVARDPTIAGTFGFGRRICAGRHLADASVWITVASVLSVFDISHAVDGNGRKIDVNHALNPRPGFFCHPQPFKCSITPRSTEAEALIRRLEHA